MNNRAWVTGAGGLIGSWLVRVAPESAPDLSATGLTRADLDLLDFDSVRERFKREKPGIVIHCAALSRSFDCEANPVLARRVNVEVTALLAELAADATFVFFSTDLVFDGRAGNYSEDAQPNPLSVYAETKAAAEALVLANPKHLVIRTSLNGGISPSGDRGFNEQMRLAWQAGKRLRLFADEFRSPIAAEVTARATWELARQNADGVFHIAGRERLSRWDIGLLLAERWPSLNPGIDRTSLKEYQGAPRAPDTSLNCEKAQRLLSFPLPKFSVWLASQPENSF